jgi:hypothetical protein
LTKLGKRRNSDAAAIASPSPSRTIDRHEDVMKYALSVLVLFASVSAAWAEPSITKLDVYPPDINLATKADLQRYVVVATRDDGVTLDVTAQSAVKLVDSGLCRHEKKVL